MTDSGRLTFLQCAFILYLWRQRFSIIKCYYPQTALTTQNDLLTAGLCYFYSPAWRLSTLFSSLQIFCHPFTGAFCKFLDIRVDAFRNSPAASGRATNSFFCFVPPVISIQTLFLQSLLFPVSSFLFFTIILIFPGFLRQPLCNTYISQLLIISW